MNISDTTQRRLAEDLKTTCVQAYQDAGITQEQLADALKTTQGNVSRWFAYSTDQHLPAFLIPMLPRPVLEAVIAFLASAGNMMVVPTIKLVDQLNGSLDDEIVAIIEKIGSLSEEHRKSPHLHVRLKKRALEIIELAERMELELEKEQKR
mgnify:FL=1